MKKGARLVVRGRAACHGRAYVRVELARPVRGAAKQFCLAPGPFRVAR